LKGGLEMCFSMDNQTIICYDKDYKVKKLGVILFDADTFEKIGEYLVDRTDPTLENYEKVFNPDFRGLEYNK